jgi:uncharacterized protein (DUF2147 family)
MRALFTAAMIASLTILPAAQAADETSPVGLWKNIDDVTGKPKALIRITENKGELQGRLEKLYLPANQDQNPLCTLCTGAHKDEQVLGMTFMWGLKKDGQEYSGGEILDPDNGKVYRSKMTLIDGGKKLNVRGYIGVPMFGRSQVWVRQE